MLGTHAAGKTGLVKYLYVNQSKQVGDRGGLSKQVGESMDLSYFAVFDTMTSRRQVSRSADYKFRFL